MKTLRLVAAIALVAPLATSCLKKPTEPGASSTDSNSFVVYRNCPSYTSRNYMTAASLSEAARAATEDGSKQIELSAGTLITVTEWVNSFAAKASVQDGLHKGAELYLSSACLRTVAQAKTEERKAASCTEGEWNLYYEINAMAYCFSVANVGENAREQETMAIKEYVAKRKADATKTSAAFRKVQRECSDYGTLVDRKREERYIRNRCQALLEW